MSPDKRGGHIVEARELVTGDRLYAWGYYPVQVSGKRRIKIKGPMRQKMTLHPRDEVRIYDRPQEP